MFSSPVKEEPCFAPAFSVGGADDSGGSISNNEGVNYEAGTEGKMIDLTQAVECYQRSAKLGNAFGLYNLGMCRYFGKGCIKDEKEAIKLWQKASEQNHADATNNLGVCAYNGEVDTKDRSKAAELFKKAAELGCVCALYNLALYYADRGDKKNEMEYLLQAGNKQDPNAAYMLGLIYEKGDGVDKNMKEAVRWYDCAAKQKHSAAMVNLGLCIFSGNGVEKAEPIRAAELWTAASDLGNTDAMFNLGVCLMKGDEAGITCSKKKAILLWQNAAMKGHASAKFYLGTCFDDGVGVACNKEMALNLYEQAASLGNTQAMNALGLRYEYGEVVKEDPVKAREWYEKAAGLGDISAMNNLAQCYFNGVGVRVDKEKAIKLFTCAAEKGDAQAMFNLATCLYSGDGIRCNKVRATELFESAAKAGHALSMYQLGRFYAEGENKPQDWKKAVELFKNASDFAIPDALFSLGQCYETGNGVSSVDMTKAIRLYRRASAMGHESARKKLSGIRSKSDLMNQGDDSTDGAKLEPFKLRVLQDVNAIDEKWYKVLPFHKVRTWEKSPVQMCQVYDTMVQDEFNDVFETERFAPAVAQPDVPMLPGKICFDPDGEMVPVREMISVSVRFTLNSSHSYSFRILGQRNQKFQFYASPNEGYLKKSWTSRNVSMDIKLVLRVRCTTVVNLHIPVIFWKGSSSKNVFEGGNGPDDVFVCYLDSKVQSKLSTSLDPAELTLYSPELGHGGFGFVYRGRYRGQDVACKVPRRVQELLPFEINDFYKEVNHFETLRHPCIVLFIGAVCMTGSFCIVTEYCKYGSLLSAMTKYGPRVWTIRMKLKALLDTAKAMAFLHESSIIHRDLKPDNMLVTSIEETSPVICKLSDFGTTKAESPFVQGQKTMELLGTPIYMAPELIQRKPNCTNKVDVYSFGIMMASLADNGSEPYRTVVTNTRNELHDLIVSGIRPEVEAKVPTDYTLLMSSCWDPNPDKRPSFAQIIPRLEDMLALFH